MLRKLEEREFDQYVDFAYGLSLNKEQSGYPTYADGMKTKQDFVSRARKAFDREHEEILLFEQNGRVAGWIHYYFLPEDHYLDTCAFCAAQGMGQAINEFTAFARQRFSGSHLYLGFPKENREAVLALEQAGFNRIEESCHLTADLACYVPQAEPAGITAVTRDNFHLFAALHAQHDGEMYWNTQRIFNDMSEWSILLLLRNGKTAGAIYSMLWDDRKMEEIFGLDFPDGMYDGPACRDLLTAALNAHQRRGARYLVYFSDPETQADALACGFRQVGEYVCYKAELS